MTDATDPTDALRSIRVTSDRPAVGRREETPGALGVTEEPPTVTRPEAPRSVAVTDPTDPPTLVGGYGGVFGTAAFAADALGRSLPPLVFRSPAGPVARPPPVADPLDAATADRGQSPADTPGRGRAESLHDPPVAGRPSLVPDRRGRADPAAEGRATPAPEPESSRGPGVDPPERRPDPGGASSVGTDTGAEPASHGADRAAPARAGIPSRESPARGRSPDADTPSSGSMPVAGHRPLRERRRSTGTPPEARPPPPAAVRPREPDRPPGEAAAPAETRPPGGRPPPAPPRVVYRQPPTREPGAVEGGDVRAGADAGDARNPRTTADPAGRPADDEGGPTAGRPRPATTPRRVDADTRPVPRHELVRRAGSRSPSRAVRRGGRPDAAASDTGGAARSPEPSAPEARPGSETGRATAAVARVPLVVYRRQQRREAEGGAGTAEPQSEAPGVTSMAGGRSGDTAGSAPPAVGATAPMPPAGVAPSAAERPAREAAGPHRRPPSPSLVVEAPGRGRERTEGPAAVPDEGESGPGRPEPEPPGAPPSERPPGPTAAASTGPAGVGRPAGSRADTGDVPSFTVLTRRGQTTAAPSTAGSVPLRTRRRLHPPRGGDAGPDRAPEGNAPAADPALGTAGTGRLAGGSREAAGASTPRVPRIEPLEGAPAGEQLSGPPHSDARAMPTLSFRTTGGGASAESGRRSGRGGGSAAPSRPEERPGQAGTTARETSGADPASSGLPVDSPSIRPTVPGDSAPERSTETGTGRSVDRQPPRGRAAPDGYADFTFRSLAPRVDATTGDERERRDITRREPTRDRGRTGEPTDVEGVLSEELVGSASTAEIDRLVERLRRGLDRRRRMDRERRGL